MNEKPNYYSVLPAIVRYDPDLTPTAKLLYSEITSLVNKTGVCWASDKYFAYLYGVSDRVIRKYLKQLKEKKYIELEYEYEENSKEIKQRKILIIGMEQIFHTYGTNVPRGMEQKFLDNNKYINNKKEIYKEKIVNDINFSDKFKNTLIEWLEYKKYSYEELGFKKLLTIIKNNLKEHSEEDLMNIIDESIANNYKGITFNKLNNNFRKVKKEETKMVNDDGVYRIV